MKTDTEIRHVTKRGANLFLELALSLDEAMRLHAASKKQIADSKRLTEQLKGELAVWIEREQECERVACGLTQERLSESSTSTLLPTGCGSATCIVRCGGTLA